MFAYNKILGRCLKNVISTNSIYVVNYWWNQACIIGIYQTHLAVETVLISGA